MVCSLLVRPAALGAAAPRIVCLQRYTICTMHAGTIRAEPGGRSTRAGHNARGMARRAPWASDPPREPTDPWRLNRRCSSAAISGVLV
jgi:hypothetical protein